jgi:hypothetical protein
MNHYIIFAMLIVGFKALDWAVEAAQAACERRWMRTIFDLSAAIGAWLTVYHLWGLI